MEAMAARMQASRTSFKLRKTLAEHPFGTIKTLVRLHALFTQGAWRSSVRMESHHAGL